MENEKILPLQPLLGIGMKKLLPIFFVFFGFSVSAQAPSGYYSAAYHKKGYALRVALHNIIDSSDSLSYKELWDAYQQTDKNPQNNKVWDMYSDNPDGTAAYYYDFSDRCGNYRDEGDCYNREHSIPQSWFGEQMPMRTDLFHVYPTDGYVNNKRANYPFGEVDHVQWVSTNGSKLGTGAADGPSDTVFEPIDAYKGDFARSVLYMAVRYMDQNLGCTTQSMYASGSLKPWALLLMLRWHAQDPVSQKEIDRNNAVFAIQHNRNPFIDHPELAGKIWGEDSVNAFDPNAVPDYNANALLTVCPNPTSDKVTVTLSDAFQGPVTVRLFNAAGELLLVQTASGGESVQLELKDCFPGFYLIRISGDNFVLNRKLLKL